MVLFNRSFTGDTAIDILYDHAAHIVKIRINTDVNLSMAILCIIYLHESVDGRWGEALQADPTLTSGATLTGGQSDCCEVWEG